MKKKMIQETRKKKWKFHLTSVEDSQYLEPNFKLQAKLPNTRLHKTLGKEKNIQSFRFYLTKPHALFVNIRQPELNHSVPSFLVYSLAVALHAQPGKGKKSPEVQKPQFRQVQVDLHCKPPAEHRWEYSTSITHPGNLTPQKKQMLMFHPSRHQHYQTRINCFLLST